MKEAAFTSEAVQRLDEIGQRFAERVGDMAIELASDRLVSVNDVDEALQVIIDNPQPPAAAK